MKKQLIVASLLTVVAASTATAQCAQTFGTLSAATWGGTGIPNDHAVITNCGSLTLGLTAHSRGNGNPAVTDNGISTFFAAAGADVSTAPPAQPTYATWNFGFFVGSSAPATDLGFRLYYDFDAAPGSAGLGYFQWSGFTYQDSWNNGMAFLSNPALVSQVPTGAFNRNAAGDYSYRLVAYSNGFQSEIASVNMNVITSTVPEPSTYVLMASGLLALGLAARRRRAVPSTTTSA